MALKLLRKDLGEEIDYGARLQQEARVAASVNHPNVIQVFSSGADHGQFYLVMELVDRGSLDDFIEEQKRLPEELVLEAGIQVAKGLRAAHAKGLIHRDVKPANILFADEHMAKIGDFGLAGVAAETAENRGEIWGTPYYVAPERLNNEPGTLAQRVGAQPLPLKRVSLMRPGNWRKPPQKRNRHISSKLPCCSRPIPPGISPMAHLLLDKGRMRRVVTWVFLSLFVLCASAKQLPLTTKDVGLLLRGGYSSASVMRELSSRHFADTVDAAKETMLVQAGATPDLISALKAGTYSVSKEEIARAQEELAAQAKRKALEAEQSRRFDTLHQAAGKRASAPWHKCKARVPTRLQIPQDRSRTVS